MTARNTEAAARPFRLALVAAVGLFVLGRFWDARWHSRHPGRESGADMLEAHGVIYLAVLVALVAAALAVTRFRGRRGAFVAALAGAAAAAVGHALDVAAHSAASARDPAGAHLLFTIGEVVVIVAALNPFVTALRRRLGAVGAPGK